MKTWRDVARPIIAKAIAENLGKPEKEIRKALRRAYPFGERKYHPYKIWLDEIRVQLGLKTFHPSGRQSRTKAEQTFPSDRIKK